MNGWELRVMATVTRAHLSEAVQRAVGLPYDEIAKVADSVLDMFSERLSAGEAVKLSSFGTFTVRGKSERMGRNPKTGEKWPISARRFVVFRPSIRLQERVKHGMADNGPDAGHG